MADTTAEITYPTPTGQCVSNFVAALIRAACSLSGRGERLDALHRAEEWAMYAQRKVPYSQKHNSAYACWGRVFEQLQGAITLQIYNVRRGA
jgi:hypothetical protein